MLEPKTPLPAAVPGMPWMVTVDRDHIQTRVDGDWETFSRHDVYSQMFGSGLAHFGPVTGDWRMIEAIAEDVQEAFRRIEA